MMDGTFKTLLKQKLPVLALISSVFLISFPCISIGENHSWSSHTPTTWIPIVGGGILLAFSLAVFLFEFHSQRKTNTENLDFSLVTESDGSLSTATNGCEIIVIEGRVEECIPGAGAAVALPCNEYFDDKCAHDTRSALGAYVNRIFGDQVELFVDLAKVEASRKLGKGTIQQKTETEVAESFGSGKCVLLLKPLGRPTPIALISTTTQRAGQGLATQISCLFEGMRELNKCVADERINEILMPVMGGGHGGLHPPMALVGLLLAVAEAARYGHGAQRLKRVTIVVFKKDGASLPIVDKNTVRRTLALISSQS